MVSPHVNYEAAADDYARRRAPRDARLLIWGAQVRPHLEGSGVVLDLAAGTGGFSEALLDWGAGQVVAIEPSSAMQANAAPATGVHRVRGRAETVPLRPGSADAIWISTAFHHFEEPSRAVAECRRVLTSEGSVLIRGFVPGHTELAWLSLFPGREKAVARFQSFDDLKELFADAGFHLAHHVLVEEVTQTYADRAACSESMRHADSILTALSDAEVDAGIAALNAQPDVLEHFALSLLVFSLE